VFLSIKEADKGRELAEIIRTLDSLGFSIVATRGTAAYCRAQGVQAQVVNKVYEGRPHIVDAMKSDEVQLVFNTTEDAKAIADSFALRRTALINSIPYYTTVAGARAAVRAIAALSESEQLAVCYEITDARNEGYSWDELARAAAAGVGRTARPVRVPAIAIRALGLLGDVAALGGIPGMLTSQKAREILHPDWRSTAASQPPSSLWLPEIDLRTGFAEAVAWYRAAGWLGG